MAEKQTILGRIAQLAKANINALLDKAEDPQKMIDQLIRDYTNSIIEAENAIAQTLGNLRMAERDYEEDVKAAADWGQKAAAASAKADSLRAAGDEAGADKWDNLAKVALGKQIQFENEVKTEEPALATQRDVAERLKTGLAQMKDKLSELKSRRDQLIARSRTRGQGLQEGHRIEVVDVDDVEPGQAHLEGVHVVFEVDDLQASFLQLVELGGEELLEAHDSDAAALVEESLDLGQEVGVVAGQDHVARAELRDRVHGALEADVDDLHVGRTRQGDDRVVHGRERLDEAHRQEAGGSVEEEQALGLLAPAAVRALEDTIPAGALLGVRATVKDRKAKRRVNILAIYDEVCRLIIRIFHGIRVTDDCLDLCGLGSYV